MTDKRVGIPIRLLPTTIVRIDEQCERLMISRWKAIEVLVDHGLEWLEELPDALGPPT
jgi:hypothetical protein